MSDQQNEQQQQKDPKDVLIPTVTIMILGDHSTKPQVLKNFEKTDNDQVIPGTFEMVGKDVRSGDLDDLKGLMFVGKCAGSSGKHNAQMIMCAGGPEVLGHPCDEQGRLALGTNLYDLNSPLWIGANTAQFYLQFRQVLQSMLTLADAAERKKKEKEAQQQKAAEGSAEGEGGIGAKNDVEFGEPTVVMGPPPGEKKDDKAPAEA